MDIRHKLLEQAGNPLITRSDLLSIEALNQFRLSVAQKHFHAVF